MRIWRRLLVINAALWGYVAWWSLVRADLLRPRIEPAQRLAFVLEGLGTTFVKLGQGLSLHRELLPDEYVAQLARLQDHVQPFGADAARQEIEMSFGRKIESLFTHYEPEPFAAGSIAQVHRATMSDGTRAIVKVRRPGIRHLIEEDVRILRWFAGTLCWVLPSARRLRPQDLIDELSRNLRKEIDFKQEALNIQRFGEMFAGSHDIYVPGVIDGLYTDWVMVQEMSTGERIDAPRFSAEGPRLAKALVEAYLHQFFVAGTFHGDPHPGNLFVLADGRICFHDFGLVGFLDQATRLNVLAFMLAFSQHDAQWLVDAFQDLGMLAPGPDEDEVRLDVEEIIEDYGRKPLRDWSFGEAFLRVARLGHGQKARVPHRLLVLLRAIFLMENTVRKLDPAFNLVEGLFARGAQVLQQAQTSSVPALDRLKFEAFLFSRQGTRHVGKLAHQLRSALEHGRAPLHVAPGPEADAGARRVAAALLAAGLYPSGVWLLVSDVGPAILGVPALAAAALAAAAMLTWRCMRGGP